MSTSSPRTTSCSRSTRPTARCAGPAPAAVEIAGLLGASSPAAAQGTVVAGFSSGELNAYRYENGQNIWQDALSRTSISTSVTSLSDIDADPVIDAGRVYAVGQGGRMVAIELITGQRVWEINVAGIATPWVAGDWIFVVTDQAQLLALSRTNGKIRWMTQLPRWRDEKDKKGRIDWVGPILAGDRLVLANSVGQIVNVSPYDGSVQTTVETKNAGVAVADRRQQHALRPPRQRPADRLAVTPGGHPGEGRDLEEARRALMFLGPGLRRDDGEGFLSAS